jgi:ketosteroid isomerase-like protein
MSNETRKAVESYYAAIHSGDFDVLFNVLHDDCTIEYYGPSVIPFAGFFRGKEKCRIFFGHVANDVDILEFSQLEFIYDGAGAAVTGRLVLKFKSSGRVYESEYAHIITVKDGQVLRFRDFQNSAKAAAICEDLETPER